MNHLKCFIRQTILCLSVLCSSVSFAAKQVVIGSVQVPEGSSPLQVFITTSDQELLEKYSPQKLKNSEKLRALLNQIKESPGTVAKESGQGLLKIQGDFGLFASAVGLVSVQKLLTDYDRNPNALKAFWIHMIKDPFAWLSFYTFVVANRGSSAAYEALATKLGWIRDEKLFTQFMDTLAEAHFGKNLMGVADENMIHAALIYERAKALIPEPKFDFFLKELKAPFGLAAGIFLTGLTYDFISDPNVQRCATDWSNQNDQIINYCEVAYQEWLVHGRIVDYAPEMAGAALTSIFQTAIIRVAMPKFIQSMKRTSSVQKALEFKGVGFAVSKAAKFINNKSVAFVASTFVFLEFCPLITRPFEEIYFSAKLGNSLAKTEADLATYKNFEKSIPNYMSLIEIFSQESSKWRAHWQAPVKAKMQAWLDYISQLQNNYFSSKLFYHELVSRLSVPNPQDRLFVAHPYNGIDEHASFEAIAQKIVNAVRLAEKKIKNIQALGSKASENQIQTVSFMSSIISSLLSIDDQRPPNVALQAQYEKIRRTPSLLESQRERLKNEARQNEFVVGIKLLQKLASDSVFGPLGFIEVNEILKGAHPLARGEFELERMDRNSHLIIQDTKENSKMNIGNVVAHSKAEYLLAEFVCGRKALIREYWGIGVYYHPPQMTIPQSFDYCEIRPENISQSENSWGVTGSIYKGRDGTEVDGLIGLATQYLRPEFRGREGVTHFENFWESSVEPQVKAKTAQKNNEFSKLLNSDLVPILNDDSIHHSHGVSLPKGTYSSLEHEFSVYISILKEIKQKYKLPMDIGSVQIIFDRQARLLKKKETFAEVLKSFSLTEIDKVSKKLTLALTDFKNIDAKKTERTKIQALSEFLDDKMDLAFGTLIETSASRPEIIPLMIFLKIKIKGIEVQFENLVALEDALQVSGL